MPDHILICGAGILGASLAYHLSGRGPRVTVIDQGPAAGVASGRSFGWINASFFANDAHHALRAAGIAAHRRLSRDLDAPTAWQGCLWWEEQGDAFDTQAATLARLGYDCREVSGKAFAMMEPHIATPPERALFFADEGATDLALLTERLLAAAAAKGAQVWLGAKVKAVLAEGSRVTGLRTEQGDIRADTVILAAGTATPALLAPLGLHLPMLPRPGAMIWTQPLPPVLTHILAAPMQELRQDGAGRLVAPASANHQGDQAEAITDTPADLARATLSRLRALLPRHPIALERVTLAQRPVPGDGLPVIGPAGPEGLHLAVMHSGATLGPIAAELLADEVMGEVPSNLLAPFRPARIVTAK